MRLNCQVLDGPSIHADDDKPLSVAVAILLCGWDLKMTP